jgi:hypothetical protein
MTNSPQMRQAEAWTQQQFKTWGLRNVHKEAFPFGRGWSIVSSSVRMTTPRVIQLTAIPVAWTPGTGAAITAPIVVAPMKRERDFEAWRGKLAGKIVLVTLPDDGGEPADPPFKRYTDDEIGKLDRYRQPDYDPASVELDSNVHYDDSDTQGYNIIAEIPGSDPQAGYVMAGAHLDSWVAADGAADNGAGSAVVMEAARILATLGVRPRRTIRFALWSGEEQGLFGSHDYVARHLATRPPTGDAEIDEAGPYTAGRVAFPITPRPGFHDLKLYLNLDNGSGKLRGLHAEGNVAAVPVLKGWLAPYAMLGAGAVVAKPTGSTDHVGMVRLGLPAYQFIQDPLDYETTVHHSSSDTFDHLRTDDLRQAAAVMAGVLLSAANSEKVVPGNVVPGRADDSDPFRYKDPAAE